MYDLAAISSWIEFAVRWVHVITAIAWIGSSFYFIALDLGLHRDRNLASGADGEEWQVHGGGFYHIQKYLIAPDQMPGDLIWFKWESYATWLSGFALLVLVYYLGAEFYLVDPSVADIGTVQAVLISLASLTFGWIAYDQICKSKFGDDNTRLMILLYVILVGMAWGYNQIFTGAGIAAASGGFYRDDHVGQCVFSSSCRTSGLWSKDLQAGPRAGSQIRQDCQAAQSTHNNYLTLPVIFLMLSKPLSAGLCHRDTTG